MMRRSPDFICIGAQKAGTSWLRENLRLHPRVWLPMVSELHYFGEPPGGSSVPSRLARERCANDAWRSAALAHLQLLAAAADVAAAAWWAIYSFVDRNDQWYRSLFAFAPPGSVVGDFTPRYMLCGVDEIEHMHRVAPDAKLLFLLRRPVERFWSQCRMKHEAGTLEFGEPAAMQLFDLPNGRPRGEYSAALLRFCRVFKPENILVLFHEGIIHEPAALLDAVHEFLGLAPVPLDMAALRRPVNQSASTAPLSPGLRSRLEAAYRVEMETLAEVFGGYAAEWLGRRAVEPPRAAVRLSASHVEALSHRREQAALQRARRNTKVFCLSMQRSGTTSVGDWLEAHGLARAGSPTSVRLGWTRMWLAGAYDAIFASETFGRTEIFEDDPWWCPGFFRVVARRYPQARFILLERDPDAWFDSLCRHSGGLNPGWSDVHARVYEREGELESLLTRNPALRPDAWGLLSIVEHREHYRRLYQRHSEAVRAFFASEPERLLIGRLEDPAVFPRICHFVGVSPDPEIPIPRANASTDEMRERLKRYVASRGNGGQP
jgi:hypothetical protein